MKTPTIDLRCTLANPMFQWFTFLLGPFAWTFQLLAVYAFTEWACRNGATLLLHVLAAISLGLAGLAVGCAWHEIQESRKSTADQTAQNRRSSFMAKLGLWTSATFFVVILAQWLAVCWLGPCPSTL